MFHSILAFPVYYYVFPWHQVPLHFIASYVRCFSLAVVSCNLERQRGISVPAIVLAAYPNANQSVQTNVPSTGYHVGEDGSVKKGPCFLSERGTAEMGLNVRPCFWSLVTLPSSCVNHVVLERASQQVFRHDTPNLNLVFVSHSKPPWSEKIPSSRFVCGLASVRSTRVSLAWATSVT